MRYLFILFALCCLRATVFAQNPVQIDSTFDRLTDTVRQYKKGQLLAIGVERAYLLNEQQIQHYRLLLRLKRMVNEDRVNIEQIFNNLIKSLSTDLATLKDLNDKMRQNADSASIIGVKLATKTLENAAKADNLLKTATTHLDSATARLNLADLKLQRAEELIRKEKRDRLWRNLKWGGIGVGIGFIVRSLIK